MKHTIIIGYGNPLRGDDGAGWQAAERLRSEPGRPGLRVVACHQLTPELAEPLSRADRVVFVDAVAGAESGAITVQRILPSETGSPSFTHHLDPATLLGLARLLYGAAPRDAIVVTIAAASFGYAEQLSPPVEAAMRRLLQLISELAHNRIDAATLSERL